jgi:trehalose/maltose hydrolase-like predicted phosphorylase
LEELVKAALHHRHRQAHGIYTMQIFQHVISTLCYASIALGDSGGGQYATGFSGVTWDDDNWRLINSNLDPGHYQSRISLANGYFGINLASVGPFMDFDVQVDGDNINGWPLFDTRQSFATIAGFYDLQANTNGDNANGTNFLWLNQYGGESVISGIPHFGGLLLEVNGNLLSASVDPSQISNFVSTLDIGQGLMSWKYDWTPPGSAALSIEYDMLVHKLLVNRAAVQLNVRATQDVNVTVIDLLDGDCAVRSDFVDKAFDADSATIYSAVSPNGIASVKAWVYSMLTMSDGGFKSNLSQATEGSFLGSNQSSIAQQTTGQLSANKTYNFAKFVGAASTDAFQDAQNTAKDAASQGAKAGWSSMLGSHKKEWQTVMPKDSVDSFALASGKLPNDTNIMELQITAVTNPFYLLQNTISTNALNAAGNNSNIDTHSISVSGLGSDSYAGMIFWDADVWMAPGLVVSHPDAARQIVGYRSKLLPQAQKNVQEAFTSSQNQSGKFSPGGAAYPWTSGRFGNCTGSGPCFDYEYHLNGDIGLNIYNYYVATGDKSYFKQELLPVYDAIAWFYAELLAYNSTSALYELTNATDPDEYANNVDNPGYTMELIKTHLQNANVFRESLGMPHNETWANRSSLINVPVNSNASIILEYSSMNGSISVKQADIVLIDDFFDVKNPYGLSDLDYYAGKQSPDGPGMTYGVFSIVANSLSPSGCSSYTYGLYGSQPYVRAPWYQYSEQILDDFQANGGTHPAYPFLTGIGGAHRVVPFGYLGLKMLMDSFNINPNLPPQITYLKYRTLYWQGHAISAWSNVTHTTLTRLSKSLPNANSTYSGGSIPVTIGDSTSHPKPLAPGGTLVVENRVIGYNASFNGNIVQCKPVASNATWEPGQFPLAAVDGANSTKWQPAASNITSSLIISLDHVSGIKVTGFHFDWAQNPPTGWQVDFADSFDFGNFTTAGKENTVNVSSPYDASTAAVIAPYIGNTTDVFFIDPLPAPDYVRLSIWGNQGSDSDKGAAVAEFVVIREGGGQLVPNGVVHSL